MSAAGSSRSARLRVLFYQVEKRQGGMTAAGYLKHCHGCSRRMITRLKQGRGSLAVNGRLLERLTERLAAGDLLELRLEPDPLSFFPNPALAVPTLYEDEDIAVFSKPAGMPVHPSHLHREDTLANFFAARCIETGEQAGFHPLNRLDRDTSGLCLIAKHPLAADRLAGRVEKRYYAVAEGMVDPPEGTLSFPIARAEGSIILRRVSPDGKPAVTHYRTLMQGNGHTLLEIRLETGRTHQIRVHFSHIGHPLAGDELYGGSRLLIPRQALHCGELRFPHPISGEALSFSAPVPEEMRRLLRPVAPPFSETP